MAAPVPDTGSVRRDLVEMVAVHASMLQSFDRALMVDLLTAMMRDETFAAEVDERLLQAGLRHVASIVQRARDRGEMSGDDDVLHALENLGGALIYRIFMLHRTLDTAAVEVLVDALLRSAT